MADSGIVNQPLEKFLLQLSVDDDLRTRFTQASKEERETILRTQFRIGEPTIAAIVSGSAGRVKARLRFSDQQGTPPPVRKAAKATPAKTTKAAAKSAKKR